MIVVHFICDLLEGGAQKSALSLIENTNDTISNYLVLLENKQKYTPDFVPIYSVIDNKKLYKKMGVIGDFLLAKKLLQVLHKIENKENKKVDIVISHMEVTAKVLYFLKDYQKIFYIRTNIAQELWGLSQQSKIRAWRRKKTYQRILKDQHLMTVSKGVLEDLQHIPIAYRSAVNIYNPFDPKAIQEKAKKHINGIPDYPYMLHPTSYRNAQKRHDILFEAMNLMHHKIKLVMLSDPVMPLLVMIDKYNLSDRIHLTGFQENPYPFFKQATLTVLSSEREGLPRVVIESLILNTPIVSTDCPSGPREILTGDLSAYLAITNDPKDLAKKIDAALDSYPSISPTLLSPFSKETNIEIYKKTLQEICAQ